MPLHQAVAHLNRAHFWNCLNLFYVPSCFSRVLRCADLRNQSTPILTVRSFPASATSSLPASARHEPCPCRCVACCSWTPCLQPHCGPSSQPFARSAC